MASLFLALTHYSGGSAAVLLPDTTMQGIDPALYEAVALIRCCHDAINPMSDTLLTGIANSFTMHQQQR